MTLALFIKMGVFYLWIIFTGAAYLIYETPADESEKLIVRIGK
jgi:hypothetical protein